MSHVATNTRVLTCSSFDVRLFREPRFEMLYVILHSFGVLIELQYGLVLQVRWQFSQVHCRKLLFKCVRGQVSLACRKKDMEYELSVGFIRCVHSDKTCWVQTHTRDNERVLFFEAMIIC